MYTDPMANIVSVSVLGNQLVINVDDGRKLIAYPTGNDIFMLKDKFVVGDKPVVIEPDPVPPPTGPPNPGGGNGSWQWPFQYSRYVIQGYALAQYGVRIHPISGVRKMHNGLDFGGAGIKGLPIPAAADGTVKVNAKDARGNNVSITHAGGFQTNYFHMRDAPLVKTGQVVTKGTTLGYVGTTGSSTGNHLHWETLSGGQFVNPRDFMKARGVPEN